MQQKIKKSFINITILLLKKRKAYNIVQKMADNGYIESIKLSIQGQN